RGEPPGGVLKELITSASDEVTVAVLRAIGREDLALRDFIGDTLGSPAPSVREAALEAGLAMGLPAALLNARREVESQAVGAGLALTALAISGHAADAKRLIGALEEPRLRAGAVLALGFSGWS